MPRRALVLGKIAGGTLLAVVQAAAFIALAMLLRSTGLVTSLDFSLGAARLLVVGKQ